MKKLMLIYYNIVAVLTILYLVLTATLMNLGNAFITTHCHSQYTDFSHCIWNGICEEEIPG